MSQQLEQVWPLAQRREFHAHVCDGQNFGIWNGVLVRKLRDAVSSQPDAIWISVQGSGRRRVKSRIEPENREFDPLTFVRNFVMEYLKNFPDSPAIHILENPCNHLHFYRKAHLEFVLESDATGLKAYLYNGGASTLAFTEMEFNDGLKDEVKRVFKVDPWYEDGRIVLKHVEPDYKRMVTYHLAGAAKKDSEKEIYMGEFNKLFYIMHVDSTNTKG